MRAESAAPPVRRRVLTHWLPFMRCMGRKRNGETCSLRARVERDGIRYCGKHDPQHGLDS